MAQQDRAKQFRIPETINISLRGNNFSRCDILCEGEWVCNSELAMYGPEFMRRKSYCQQQRKWTYSGKELSAVVILRAARLYWTDSDPRWLTCRRRCGTRGWGDPRHHAMLHRCNVYHVRINETDLTSKLSVGRRYGFPKSGGRLHSPTWRTHLCTSRDVLGPLPQAHCNTTYSRTSKMFLAASLGIARD